jgi:hypothetical protein
VSNYQAIAAVTRALRDLLFTGVNAEVGGTHVTTLPPDLARNGETFNQINLFLYLTSIDAAWRNMDMPDRVHPGEVGFPPLPLALHYMITAFGKDDDDSDGHLLLGRAMSVLHDRPLLSPAELHHALPESDLDHQVERVRLTPETLTIDEMSRLWTTFQTQYRISAAYQASVVLIDSNLPVRAAPPVLARGEGDTGPVTRSDLQPPPVPTLLDVALDAGIVTLSGHDLAGTNVAVRLTHPALADPVVLAQAALQSTSDDEISFPLPAGIPAGTLTIVALVKHVGPPIATNEIVLAILPQITSPLPLSATRDGSGIVDFQVDVAPPVTAGQHAFLLVGHQQVVPRPFVPPAPPASTLTFHFAIDPGDYLVRLRVGGVDSEIVDRSVTPPVFDTDQRLVVH